MEERVIRDVAKEMGVSPATLLRIEQGKPCESGTFAKILLWLIGKEQK